MSGHRAKALEDTAREIGAALKERIPSVVKDFNVVKGFLNIELSQDIFIDEFKKAYSTPDYGYVKADENAKAVMVEYSSPNTNKPLHLGHVRNNLLGYSVAKLLEASGKKVYKTQIINDRGIHICKSMLAWELFGGGETPESSGMKGDKLVGKYYVEFDKAYKKEVDELKAAGMTEEEAKKNAPLMKRAQQMLLLWETGDPHVRELWERMNRWVYDGFGSTYKRLGVEFDKNYYESQTYLLGKDNVEEGLEKGVFYRRADGSVWIDLSGDGLDEKLVLRGDGTSVYITQDIGTAIKRFGEFDIDSLIYTVGNEQDYHFKVLFLILKKLGYAWADKFVSSLVRHGGFAYRQDEVARRYCGGCGRPYGRYVPHGKRNIRGAWQTGGYGRERKGRTVQHHRYGRLEVFHIEGGPAQTHDVQS